MTTAARQALDARSKNSQWMEICNYLENQAFDEELEQQVEAEMNRTRKLKSALLSIFDRLDPDFTTIAALSVFDTNISNAHAQFLSYKQAGTIDYLKSVNDSLSTAYISLKNCLHETDAEQSQLASVLVQNQEMVVKTFRSGAAKIKNDARKALQDLSALNEKIDQINSAHTSIINLKADLLDDVEGKTSVLANIKTMERTIEDKLQKIKDYATQLFDENVEGGSIRGKILTVRKEIEELKKKSDGDIANLNELIEDIEDFHLLAFGMESNVEDSTETSDSTIAGSNQTKTSASVPKTIQGKLEWLIHRAELHKKNSEANTQTLIEQINSLLPRATSAGLASAFESEAKKQTLPKRVFTGLFIASLIGMVVAAAPTMIEIIPGTIEVPASWKFSKPEGIEAAMRDLLFRLPVIIPCVWLAIFSARRRSECERLQQEYLHKTALAKSYDAYKQQIDNLPEGNEELKKSLLDTMLNAISKNASETLDTKQKPIGLLQSWLASRIIRKIEE